MAVAAAIGAVLVGSATVGAADADPRSPLWPITKIIWPAHAQSIESAEQIRVALDEARVAVEAGRGGDARRAIIRAVGELPNITDAAAQDSIRSTVDQLWSRSDPSAASRIPHGGMGSVGGSAAPGPPVTSGPTARTDQVVADVIGPIAAGPEGPVGTVNAARLVPSGPSGTATDVAPSGSTLPPTASAVGSAAPVSATAPSSGPAPSTDPAAPATVPDPAAVVEPVTSDSAMSSPAVATQQSGPTPTRTTQSPGDAGYQGVSGADGVGEQPSAAADQATTSAGPGPVAAGVSSSG